MIFPTTLIVTADPDLSKNYFSQFCQTLNNPNNPNNPDILRVDNYTIAAIRQINLFLSKKAYSHLVKIVYLPDIHLLHLEAQNALLKILEEPGSNNYFFLTTSQPQKLIPTILSRCQVISLTSDRSTTGKLVYPQPNLKLADAIILKEPDLKLFLRHQLQLHQQELIRHPSLSQKKVIEKIIKAIAMTETNVDSKSALDYFLLQ